MQDRLNSERCCTYLKALADPDRLRMVQFLQQHGPVSVGALSHGLQTPLANVSHHLKQLRYAGLVTARKQGRYVMYTLASDVLSEHGEGGLDLGCCRIEVGLPKGRGRAGAPRVPSKRK
jgi:DNA-binding transcriptional ArsR family regulator